MDVTDMDVIFELENGRPSFFIEVGFFDTVLEMKEMIEKYQGIPISKQTLLLNGQVLEDDHDVAYCIKYCELLQDSRIKLIIAEDHQSDHQQSPTVIEDTKKIQLKIKIPIEMDSNDTVGTLKKKIQEMELVHLNRLALHYRGKKLQDNRILCDYEVCDNAEIDVSFQPLQPTVSAANRRRKRRRGLKKLRLMVLSKFRTQKMDVEVNASSKVGELRKKVERLHKRLINFELPQDYFFIYKQNVMDNKKSFKWHNVGQGDTIEVSW